MVVVDDEDVQRVADAVLKFPELANTSTDAQADLAYKLALGFAHVHGTTVAWQKDGA